MAQLTLAQMIKEKNSLIKGKSSYAEEITQKWKLFQQEYSHQENHTLSSEVEETRQTIAQYTAKLLELTTKNSKSNTDNLQDTSQLMLAILNELKFLEMKLVELPTEVNALKNKLKDHSNLYQTEFETPLVD